MLLQHHHIPSILHSRNNSHTTKPRQSPVVHSPTIDVKLPLPSYESIIGSDDLQSIPRSHSTILPSYHMYKSIVLKSLKLLNRPPPPPYEPPNELTTSSLQQTLSTDSLESSNNSTTILNNLSSLTNLRAVDVNIELINQKLEYRQGDVIRGTVNITNKKSYPIKFSMIYIMFEGLYDIDGREWPFLSTIDLNSFINEIDNKGTIGPDTLKPGESFYKPFYFVIPNYLLDSACSSVNRHLQLPPSLNWQKDLCIVDGSTRYRISAYVISQNLKEYINIGHTTRLITLVPFYKIDNNTVNEIFTYNYLMEIIKRDLIFISKSKINDMIASMELKSVNSLKFCINKQTYILQVPLKPIQIHYAPAIPNNPRINQIIKANFKLTIPPSFIKAMKSELISVTIKSNNTIPIAISNEMLYQTFSNSSAFNEIVSKPIKKLVSELDYKVSTISPRLSTILWKLLNISVKYVPLAIDDTTFIHNEIQDSYDVNMNLRSMYIKNLDRAVVENRFGGFNLVPSFESCHLVRKYFLKLTIKLNRINKTNNNNVLYINIPVEVVE
ncbi:uncharacterized protein RJT21DRAFT_15854 [Scheffersomyces amazonensis]|uniref:uncharacterized protein n=1 Tax=Scheffersomyces amazonensis TaxID=1078765 RepID=UPI00315DC992